MKKKRKIKIPAAAYGTATNSEMAGLVAYNNGVAYNPLQSSINNAPTPSIPNMPTKGMGAGMNMGNMVGMAGDAVDLLSNPFKRSTATSGGEAAMQSVANIGKGAAMGFTVGGPVGAIVGAGIGAIGSKGEEASMSSFTDYNEGTLGTGIMGAIGNKGLRRERRRIKMNAYNNRAAVQGTNDLENRYGLEYGDMDTNTFADGGMVPSSLAYVDDGELIQTPDGSINQVPEMGQPLDSNLVSIPEGSRILSNTLKVPGTKKTFSELGKQMMTNRKSKGKDKFAENSNMLNDRNNKMIHDQLFELQEQLKAKRGIKDKTKNVEAFQSGGSKKESLELVEPLDYFIDDYTIPTTPQDIITNTRIPRSNPITSNRDYSGIIDDIYTQVATLSPIMSNMFTKNEKGVNAVTNPYSNAISRTMRGRRFNVNPAVEDITRNRAIGNYNVGQMNTNTGANLAYRLQSAVNTDRAIASLRSQESNVNNQYLGDYANTMNSLGQQYVNAVNIANEANAQNRANARNIRRTGASQFSQWAQNRQLMRNQRNRDDAMMELYAPFLQSGFTSQSISNFNKYLRKGGSYVG